MTMSIRTNVSSLDAQRNLFSTQNDLNKALNHLSSGYRITSAADDAAGLAISENMNAQVRGSNQAARNAQDGISMVQTAEGAMNEQTAMLQRMRELAVEASNDTLSTSDRGNINAELQALKDEFNGISDRTKFNGQSLLTSSSFNATLQIGANAADTINVQFAEVHINGTATGFTALDTKLTAFDTAAQAGTAAASDGNGLIDAVDTALKTLSTTRAGLGAVQNRLEHTISNLNVTSENLSESESRIRDVNVAEETSAMTRSQVLMQAGVSVLAQANQMPQMALKLLG